MLGCCVLNLPGQFGLAHVVSQTRIDDAANALELGTLFFVCTAKFRILFSFPRTLAQDFSVGMINLLCGPYNLAFVV